MTSNRNLATRYPLDQSRHNSHLADLGEFDGVAHQVDEDLAQAEGVGMDRCGEWSDVLDGERESLLVRADAHQRSHFLDDLAGSSASAGIEPSRLDLGEVEDVVDHFQQVLSVAFDGFGGLAVVLRVGVSSMTSA